MSPNGESRKRDTIKGSRVRKRQDAKASSSFGTLPEEAETDTAAGVTIPVADTDRPVEAVADYGTVEVPVVKSS